MREFVREEKEEKAYDRKTSLKNKGTDPPYAHSMRPSSSQLKIAKTLQWPAKLWMPTLRYRVGLCD